MKNQINKNIIPYLKEIADKLFSNHAAVMVGAGFSKNAIPNSPCTIKFSDWNELGDIFFEKLNGEKPSKKDKYLNVLRLANEVEATFGRPVLDEILMNSIPDLNYSPSELHTRLLDLPWVDVFTTNYDTLLERAAENLVDYKYTIIHNKEDLIGALKPRIIKLHGSFPSERPFIITEEDYRKYPQGFAPFVNTVQQSLLENTFCLIGFSGNDPNFLQWIGWIRDNLNENVTKIYLLGAFDFTDAQIKLFEKRNIIVVNLCEGISDVNKHYESIKLFIDYLQNQKTINNPYDWPFSTKCDTWVFHNHTDLENKEELFKLATETWKKQRLLYPGWVILPEEKRSSFKYDTDNGITEIIKYHDKISKRLLCEFLYELFWRIDISLAVVPKKLADIIVDSYKDQKKNSPYIMLILMRCYRHLGDNNRWNDISEVFSLNILKYPQQIKFEYNYERTLNALFQLNYSNIKKYLLEWDISSSFPFMNAKKAGILAEIGEVVEAESILRQSLIDIRKLQTSNIGKYDWSLYSQESYIISLYQNIACSYPIQNENTIDYKAIREKYSERKLFLQQKLCNPDHENQYFKLILSEDFKQKPIFEEKYQFEINRKSYIRHLGSDTNYLINATSFLIFSEKIAQPFAIQSTIMKLNITDNEAIAAGERIADSYLSWAICTSCRVAELKLTEKLFTRDRIAGFSSDYINTLCENLIQVLIKYESDIIRDTNNEQSNFAKNLAQILPEIISRLCCRCTFEERKNIFIFLSRTYTSNNRHFYSNLNILLQRVMETFSICEQIELFDNILNVVPPAEIYPVESQKLFPPIHYCSLRKQDVIGKLKKTYTNKELEKFYELSLDKNSDIRFWGIDTLATLFELDFLTEQQSEKFAEVLWQQIDNVTKLPANTYYMIVSFFNLPHPQNIDVAKILKWHFLHFSLPNYNNASIRKWGGQDEVIRYYEEIIYSEHFLDWKYNDFAVILKKSCVFWNSGKELIKTRDFWMKSEVKNRYIVMKQAISDLCRKLENIEAKEQKLIDDLIIDFNLFNIPCLELQINNKTLLREKKNEIMEKIKYTFLSNDSEIVLDALNALTSIFKMAKSNKIYKDYAESLWEDFSTAILYKRDESLVNCLNFLGSLYLPEYRDLINQIVIQNILKMLEVLAIETNIVFGVKDIEVGLKLSIRRNCARIAYQLNIYFENKKQKIPSEIQIWKSISNSENEFAEIRNEWKDLKSDITENNE